MLDVTTIKMNAKLGSSNFHFYKYFSLQLKRLNNPSEKIKLRYVSTISVLFTDAKNTRTKRISKSPMIRVGQLYVANILGRRFRRLARSFEAPFPFQKGPKYNSRQSKLQIPFRQNRKPYNSTHKTTVTKQFRSNDSCCMN